MTTRGFLSCPCSWGKVKHAAFESMGKTTFAGLTEPAAVVAADLVKGEGLIVDQEPAAIAFLATSTIPGAFLSMSHESLMLVDGALVCLIPADLLERRRYRLKIAVNDIPSPVVNTREEEIEYGRFTQSMDRFFGFRNVVASSLELSGWWHGAAETAQADMVIELCTNCNSGYYFGRIHEMIEAGYGANEEKLDVYRKLWLRS